MLWPRVLACRNYGRGASHAEAEADEDEEAPLTIAEAKSRLALNFGVDPANVKIPSKLEATA